MIAQHGNNSAVSSAYDLTPMGTTEIPLVNGAGGVNLFQNITPKKH